MSSASAPWRTKFPLAVDKLTDCAVKLRKMTHIQCYYQAFSNCGLNDYWGERVGASQRWRSWSRCREAPWDSSLSPPPEIGHLSSLQPRKTWSWPEEVLVRREENQSVIENRHRFKGYMRFQWIWKHFQFSLIEMEGFAGFMLVFNLYCCLNLTIWFFSFLQWHTWLQNNFIEPGEVKGPLVTGSVH